jgi:hypothetical protein
MPFQSPPPPTVPPARVQEKKAKNERKDKVTQHSSGSNSPNVVTGDHGPVTIYPPGEISAGALKAPTRLLVGPRITNFPTLEIGDSGTLLTYAGSPGAQLFQIFKDSNLVIEEDGGAILVSTEIRGKNGQLVAEITKNEWKTRPSSLWDRTFDKNKLEVRDETGQVVLQVVVLPDRVRIQGIWRNSAGRMFAMIKNPDPNGFGSFITNDRHAHVRIEPLFRYQATFISGN